MFKIIQWNLNGFKNNYHELSLLINEQNPDIFSLQETHISAQCNNYIIPKGYNGYFHNLDINSTSKQGIGFIIKKHIPHKIKYINSLISALALEVNIGYTFTLLNIYIPPTQNFSFNDILDLINQIKSPILITGDINSWSPFWGSPINNNRGKIFEDIILSNNLIVLNDGSATHFSTHKTLTHVDITLVSPLLAVKCSWLMYQNLHGSDHFPIQIEMESNLCFEITKINPKFKTDYADWIKYQIRCSNIINSKNMSGNVNKDAALIQKTILSAANVAIPQTKVTLVKYSVPWWSKTLFTLREEKQNLWLEYKNTQNTNNLIAYKRAKSRFKKAVKQAKNECFEKFTSQINPSSSIKKVWADIKSISGAKTNINIKLITLNNNQLTSSKDIANSFAESWSLFSEDINFPPKFVEEKQKTLLENYNCRKLSFAAKQIDCKINMLEFENAIKNSKGKTPGFDRISYPMIKNLPHNCKEKILELFNNIFEKGIYPQSWKTAIVIPIPKPNKPSSEIGGYRPISLLPCMGKILEKIVVKRLSWFTNRNQLISANQVGFQNKKGTMDVLLHLDHFISNALSSSNHVSILSTDFEKAFDRVGIHIVLNQLKSWNVGPKIYLFVKAFLINRKFRVRINNTLSKIVSLNNGIPQGSPLSAILFIVAFDQLSKILNTFNKMEHALYADDAIIFTKTAQMSIVEETFSQIINKIAEWGKVSGATLSIEKCKIIHICKKRNCQTINVNINNIAIELVSKLRILGVIFDSKYTFKQHCLELRKQLATRLNIIKYLSSSYSCIHISTLVNVTRSLVLSKIDYALPIYGHCCKTNLQLLNGPYHGAVRRSISAFPTSPTKAILAEAGLPSIDERVKSSTFKLAAKLYNSNSSILHLDVNRAIKHKKNYKKKSAIRLCIEKVKNNDHIHLIPRKINVNKEPPWLLNNNSLILNLSELPKSSTSSEIYNNHFKEVNVQLLNEGWSFIYTDGSKTCSHTSFAVVQHNGSLITSGAINSFSSIFSAEAFAIKNAMEYASKQKGKFVICSDSKSSMDAVKNISNNTHIITNIRDLLIKYPRKLKLMWVPGHANIKGNEFADRAAAEANNTDSTNYYVAETSDILKSISKFQNTQRISNWPSYNHYYRTNNINGTKACYPSSASRQQTRLFVRLRIGHTKTTHEHILKGKEPPICNFCMLPLTISHILEECSLLKNIREEIFKDENPKKIVKRY